MLMVKGLELKVCGLWFMVQSLGLGFRIQGLGLRVSVSRFLIQV